MLKDTLLVYLKWFRVSVLSALSRGKQRPSTQTKTLFLIASHLPPNSGGGVFRPVSFIRNAAANHWICKAFSWNYKIGNPEAGDFLLRSIGDQATLRRIELNELQPSWALTPRIDGGFNNSLNMFKAVIQETAIKPDAVLATGPTFNTFLSGYYLSRYYRAELVLDYRDEWALCPFSWVEKEQLNSFFERQCCQHASKIIFTTESHRLRHEKRFPEVAAEKRIIVANGYEEDDFVVQSKFEKPIDSTAFTLSFVGNLGDHSLPTDFLRDVELIFSESPELATHFRFIFAGNKSPDAANALDSFGFQDALMKIGHIPKQDAIRLMQQSDALLILAGKGMSSYIPGKLFDYLAIGKPILFYGDKGEVTRIIEALDAGLVVLPGKTALLKQHLSSLAQNLVPIDNKAISEWLTHFSRRHLAGKLYTELNQLLEDHERV